MRRSRAGEDYVFGGGGVGSKCGDGGRMGRRVGTLHV